MVVVLTVVMIIIVIVMIIVTAATGRFDRFHALAGINHDEILVVSGIDQVVEEFLHLQPVFDQNVRSAEIGQVGGCGLKIMGPQIGRNQRRDLRAVAGHCFSEQCDRQESADHFHSLSLACILVGGIGCPAGNQADQERQCAQARKHRSHSVVKARTGLRFRAQWSSLHENGNHYLVSCSRSLA